MPYLDSVEELLEAKEGEHVQFKEAKNRFDFGEAARCCCALANDGGGKLVFGISDKRPRSVVGSRAFEQPERTRMGLIDKLKINVDFQLFTYEEKRVLVFDVKSRPIGLPILYEGVAWIYDGDTLKEMPEEKRRKIYEEIGTDFSGKICDGATVKDLDETAIEAFRAKWIEKSGNKKLATRSKEQILIDCGAMTDFGPLIANPKTLLLGAAAQAGVFVALLGAMLLGFTVQEAAAIGIIGGADGPTSIFLAGKLGQSALMGPIAVAAYSYMSLVPIIQPPIMKLCTTEKERKIKMDQLRPVSKLEKILFPIVITIVVCLILPTTAPLVGMLMLGNLFRECGVVKQLTETASNALMYIVVILLGTSVGASTSAEAFLNADTLKIVVLGLVAFAIGTFGGCMLGKLLCKLTHGKINPLIGSAGVSAVPMAARVSQKVGAEEDPTNFLLMHAMGPNVSGVIGSAVVAGILLKFFM